MRIRDFEEITSMMDKEAYYARRDFFTDIRADDKSSLAWDLWDIICESKEEKDFFNEKQWAAIKCDWKRYADLIDREEQICEIESYA